MNYTLDMYHLLLAEKGLEVSVLRKSLQSHYPEPVAPASIDDWGQYRREDLTA